MSAKGKAKASADNECNCPHCGNSLSDQSPALAPAGSSCGNHTHLGRKDSTRLSDALQLFFELTFLTSMAKCHSVLTQATYESLATSMIKTALVKDAQTPADLRTWLDDDYNVKLFKKHTKEGLKTARTELANMVLATTLDGVYERLTDLVEGKGDGEAVAQGPIACSCSLFEHMETIEDLIEGLREQYDECLVSPPRLAVNIGPLKNYILDQQIKGLLPGAEPNIDLAEVPGWAGWSKRAIPATLKRMERTFSEALIEGSFGNPFKSPHATEYLEGLKDVDGLRLYTLSALRYELSLAAKAALPDKGKGKAKAGENGIRGDIKPKSHELEASVALRLSARGASSEALWQQLGSTVGGLVNSALPSPNDIVDQALPATAHKSRQIKSSNADRAYTARQAAAGAYQDKAYKEALEFCNQAIKLEPNDLAHIVARARVYITLERYQEADDDLSWVLSCQPDDYKAYFRRALARKALGRDEEAKRDFEAALKMQPESAEAKAELAKLKDGLSKLSRKDNRV